MTTTINPGGRTLPDGHRLTVYSKPACHQCDATKKDLDRRGATYHAIDISRDEDAYNTVAALGYAAVPVVTITNQDGEVTRDWSGFRPDIISELYPRTEDRP